MIKILAIEDDLNQINMLRSKVETYNIKNKFGEQDKIFIEFRQNDDDIGKLLFEEKFDCLVVDINWGPSNPNGGRNLITKIINNKRIPIVVYSGKLNQIEDLDERFGFKKIDRTESFSVALDYIVKVKKTHIFDLLGYDGQLDKIVTEIFWKDIDKSLRAMPTEDDLDDKSLTRMLTTRVVNYLSLSNEDDKYKYYEFYINPSLTADCHNGDIYKLNDSYYLVITPECQLLKIETANLLKINFSNEIDNRVTGAKDRSKKINTLARIISEGKCFEHYIPPFNNNRHAVVNFREIITMNKSELTEDKKETTINPVYMKNIQSRFSQYYSRQGQPDIDIDHLYKYLYETNNWGGYKYILVEKKFFCKVDVNDDSYFSDVINF